MFSTAYRVENETKFSFSRPHLSFLYRITATLNFRSSDWLTFGSWRLSGADPFCHQRKKNIFSCALFKTVSQPLSENSCYISRVTFLNSFIFGFRNTNFRIHAPFRVYRTGFRSSIAPAGSTNHLKTLINVNTHYYTHTLRRHLRYNI